jgi:hypothetical protein
MKYRTGSVFVASAAMVFAAQAWNSKDYKEWTAQDVQKVLTDSPWSKKATVSFDRSGSPGDGGGSPPRRMGIGYPGGGMGMPGGGGMGMPGGGGMGMPGGGGMGMPGGGMGGPGGGEGRRELPKDVVVSWVSAMPVKEAVMRSEYPGKLPEPGEKGYTLDKPEKDYVIAVSGLPAAPQRRQGDVPADGQNPPTDEQRKTRLMAATKLDLGKNQLPIACEDVKFNQPAADGSTETLFYFPRTAPLSLDNKEVTFESTMGRLKIERKFVLKDMKYHGKLDL